MFYFKTRWNVNRLHYCKCSSSVLPDKEQKKTTFSVDFSDWAAAPSGRLSVPPRRQNNKINGPGQCLCQEQAAFGAQDSFCLCSLHRVVNKTLPKLYRPPGTPPSLRLTHCWHCSGSCGANKSNTPFPQEGDLFERVAAFMVQANLSIDWLIDWLHFFSDHSRILTNCHQLQLGSFYQTSIQVTREASRSR